MTAFFEQPLSEVEKMMVFSSTLSANIAPYGFSATWDFSELLREDSLDCDNYAVLAAQFYELLRGSGYSEEIRILGFDGGAVGNHAQLLFRSASGSLLMDPTIGIYARVEQESLMRGVPVPRSRVQSFYSYWTHPRQIVWMRTYHWIVYNALVNGLYRQRDALYDLHYPNRVFFLD